MNVRLELPSDRKRTRFTPAEAETFMRSWTRLVAPDGSTVAYVPDYETAALVALALMKVERGD